MTCDCVDQSDRKKSKKSSRLRSARRRRRNDSGSLSESEDRGPDMRTDSDLSEGTVFLIIYTVSNVPSKLRGCAAAQLIRKRRAAVSNCRSASRLYIATIKLIHYIAYV